MSEMQFWNKFQNQPTEAESENDFVDGKNRYSWEEEEGESGVHRARRESRFPPGESEPDWLQQMPVRNQRTRFVGVQTTGQSDDLPGFERISRGFQNHQLEKLKNFRTYSESGKQTSPQNPGNPRSQQTAAKRVFPWAVQQTQLLRQ
jgi:hypothetical protein